MEAIYLLQRITFLSDSYNLVLLFLRNPNLHMQGKNNLIF